MAALRFVALAMANVLSLPTYRTTSTHPFTGVAPSGGVRR